MNRPHRPDPPPTSHSFRDRFLTLPGWDQFLVLVAVGLGLLLLVEGYWNVFAPILGPSPLNRLIGPVLDGHALWYFGALGLISLMCLAWVGRGDGEARWDARKLLLLSLAGLVVALLAMVL